MDWLWRRIAAHVPPPQISPPSAPNEGTTPESVFREAAARQLDAHISTNDVLDARNMSIVSIGITVVTISFGLLSITRLELSNSATWSLRVSLGCFVLLLLLAWRASLFRGLSFRPDLLDLAEYSETYSGPVLERWVAIEYTRSAEENEEILSKKARWVGAVGILLYLEGFTLALAAMLTLL